MTDLALKAIIACLPVIALAVALYHLDSHRLLGTHFLAWMFAAGGAVAAACGLLNGAVLDFLQAEFVTYTRYGAPIIEEVLKAALVVWLFRRNRIGFLIDAGIVGFTIGAGFSFAENLFYLYLASDAHYLTWAVRGLGTAVMHGGATALFAIVSQKLTERHLDMNPLLYLPGLAIAIVLHSIFNHFPVSPILSAAVTLLILPALLFLLFERNTASIHNFLETDFAAHQRLLRQIEHGELSGCEAGRFLLDLRRVGQGPAAELMIDYFHLHTELVVSAERLLLAREQGIEIRVGDATHAKLQRMHLLERTIGRAGLHSLRPHLQFTAIDLWGIHLLEDNDPANHRT